MNLPLPVLSYTVSRGTSGETATIFDDGSLTRDVFAYGLSYRETYRMETSGKVTLTSEGDERFSEDFLRDRFYRSEEDLREREGREFSDEEWLRAFSPTYRAFEAQLEAFRRELDGEGE